MANYNDDRSRRFGNDRYREDRGYNDNRNMQRRNNFSNEGDEEQDLYGNNSRDEGRRFGPDQKYNSDNYRDNYNRDGYATNNFADQTNYGSYNEREYNERRRDNSRNNIQSNEAFDRQQWYDNDSGSYRQQQNNSYGAQSFRGKSPKGYNRSDERILEDVNDRLTDDRGVDASDIEVKVQNGEVTLTGTVNDKYQKRHAEDICEMVSGVRNVQNQLKVQAQNKKQGDSGYYNIGTGAVTSGAIESDYGSSGAAPVGAFELKKS